MKISIEHIKPIVREQQKKHERIKGLAKSVFSEILFGKNFKRDKGSCKNFSIFFYLCSQYFDRIF